MSTLAKKLSVLTLLFAVVATQSASACATCYGASDSPLAQGMNWGILVLLGFISFVLLGVSAFFIYIARRANAMAAATPQLISTETKQCTNH
jgi:heme/copper-type cytochrome/quinol oxidase subunit 2